MRWNKHHYSSIAATLLLALLLIEHASLERIYEATLLAIEVSGKTVPAWMDIRPQGTHSAITIDTSLQAYPADLYLPDTRPHAGIILLHGAVRSGKDDPRLVRFAQQLAQARFAVLVPELAGPKSLRIRADNAQGLVDAHQYLRQRLGSDVPIGIGGFSISAGLAVLAALDPAIRDDTGFLLLVGAYHDLPETLDYCITGYYKKGGEYRFQAPNQYGKWLFVLSNSDSVSSARDRHFLRLIATSRLHNPDARIDVLTHKLGDEGKAVMDYVVNTEPARSAKYFAKLPEGVRRIVVGLNLSDKALSRLHAKVLLVHGYDDTVIPYTQSIALAKAIPDGQVELFLYSGLAHVDAQSERLSDGWTVWRVFHALLLERDR